MFNLLLSNLALIGTLVFMYLGSLILNTVLGAYHNINDLKEGFSKEKLIQGAIKGGSILVGALGVTVLISLLPEILVVFGVPAETLLIEELSSVAIAGVMGSTIVRYLGDALKKFYTIIGYNKED